MARVGSLSERLFGLPIQGEADRVLFESCTGLKGVPSERVKESFVICGRRSGKSFTSALIAVFLAVFKDWTPYLSPGERGWIFIIANDKAQAGIIKSYVSGIFHSSRALKAMISQETKEEITLKNGVNVAVKTCSFRTLRGYSILCAILEEIAFWRSGGGLFYTGKERP
jgi:phage terminase large subunit-like protein